MANEATIQSSLVINHGNLQFQSKPTTFNATVTGTKGPTPGAISVTVQGTDVDLGQLITPGLCRIQNLDSANFVTVGIWDPEGSRFYPLLELLPGETYVMRLARNLQEEYATGTGTEGDDTNRLRLKADNATVNVVVEVFEQ